MLPLDINQTKDAANNFIKDHLSLLINGREDVINNGINIFLYKIEKKKRKQKKRKVQRLIKVTKKEKQFIEYWLNDKNLKKLMLLRPKRQKELIKIIEKIDKFMHKKRTRIYWFIRNIFINSGYEKLKTEDKKQFYKDLKIKTCIYCNRNYIFDVDKSGHFKGHIDHFYPKGKYPYLAMSFFNFIPVCVTCNYIKGEFDTADETKTSIHPYERKEKKLIGTTLSTSSISNLLYKFEEDVLLEKLYIEDMYNEGHKDILQELYIKFFQENTKEHFDSLVKSLNDMKFTEDEIHRFITCGYLENKEHHKRSFSKAIKDIKDEFESL